VALRLFLSLIVSIVLLAAVAPAHAQGGPIAVELTGTARGRATIAAGELALELEGLRPGTGHVVHVHAGTPRQPSASFGLLGRFTADAQGRGQLRVTQAELSASGARVDLSPDWLADGPHFLEVHVGDGAVVASGPIPTPTTAAAGLPRADLRVIAAAVGAALLVVWAATQLRPARLGRSI
jgi:hypothetical protein